MRKIVYSIFMVAVLFVCSMSLTSCEAVTAQNITNTGSHGMNGGGMGGPGMNGNGRDNGNFMGRMADADLTGKIVSVDGNTIKIEVAKQNQNNKSSNSNVGKQDSNGNAAPDMNGNQSNNNNDNMRPSQGGKLELSYTGETKTITVTSDVKISKRTGMPDKNGNDSSKSSTKVSDLKKGQVIMVWYKQNTKTVERISVIQ